MNWYIGALKKYVDFSGRARRTEFWMFTLFNVIISLVLSGLDAMLGIGLLGGIYALAVFIPSLAVGVRRLHDTGRSGWWLLIGLIPFIGFIILIFFFIQDSQAGDNEYGANPKSAASLASAAA